MRIEREISWDGILDDVKGYPARLMVAAATSVMEKMAGTIKPGKDYIVHPYEETRFDEPRFCYRYDFGVDVEEVVRCEDCVFLDAAAVGGRCTLIGIADVHGMDGKYCAWGVRRE